MNEAQRSERRVDRLVGRPTLAELLRRGPYMRSGEEMRDTMLIAARELERLYRIEVAARQVVRWDWSDNDDDCVADICKLFHTLQAPNARNQPPEARKG